MAAARRIGPAGGASGHQPPPSSTVASSTGLHLPISTSGLVTSLHQFVGSKANADPTVLSSSHSQTKASASFLPINSAAATNSSALTSTHADNNNTAALHRQKRAGFSLPLPNNLLPNTTSTSMTNNSLNPMPSSSLAKKDLENNSAQSKRCRFAVKDSRDTTTGDMSFHTSTSSNASTVIEQPQIRRSRSPNRKHLNNLIGDHHHQHHQHQTDKKVSMANGPDPTSAGVPFRPPLMIEQAEELMLMAREGKTSSMGLRILERMPHKPRGGTMILLRTSTFSKEANADGYTWTEILHQSDLITSKENHLDYRHYYISSHLGHEGHSRGHRSRTSSKFRREAYTMGDLTLITYIGDEKEAAAGASGEKPPPPPVSLQATTFHSLPRSHRYDKRPNTSEPGSLADHRLRLSHKDSRLHKSALNVVQRPRSLERSTHDLLEHELQLKRLQAMRSQSPAASKVLSRMAHPQGVHDGLIALSEELAAGKLVKNLTLFPALQITLVHPDMTREFEHACQVLYSDPMLLLGPSTITQPQDGIRLFYDITFPMGRLFVTILTFVNACYEGHPIMPLAVNIHERQFKSSHSLFWARVVGDIPALQKHRFPLMIDDAEPAVHLAVRAQAPNLVQLEGWSHRFRDIDRYLRAKGYGEEAINYFKACVCYLLNSPSKQEMHNRFRKEFEYVWPKDFVLYYRQRLLPRSGRLGRWAMAKLNICENNFLSPHANPQERFFKLVNGFRHWETLSLEQMIRAFNYLFGFFINELSLRDSGNGAFVLKTAYQPHFHQMHHPRWQNMVRVPHPTEISAWVARQHPVPQASRPPSSASNLHQHHQFMPSLVASSYTTDTAAFSESFDDVKEMEEALDRLFRESEDDDTAFFDELLRPTLGSMFNPTTGQGGQAGYPGMSGQKARHARLAFQRQQYSSSLSSNVPSPAPNGQVPSPAPEDQIKTCNSNANMAPVPSGTVATVTTCSDHDLMTTSSSGGGTVKSSLSTNVVRNSALSTIPEVSSQREGTLNNMNNMNNNHKSQPPDLIVHSTTASNWQEHSFDSSIVTEGHYDASFESEVLPVGPVSPRLDQAATTSASSSMMPATAASSAAATFTSSQRPRPPPFAHSAKKSVFSVSGGLQSSISEANAMPHAGPGPPVTSAGLSSVAKVETTKPSGLMLWKKVQHYVVVGGAFVSSAATANDGTNEQHQSNPQQKAAASEVVASSTTPLTTAVVTRKQ